MFRIFLLSSYLFFLFFYKAEAQNESNLFIEKIMEGKDFVGYWPHDIFWSDNSKIVYFEWNTENSPTDSIYKTNITNPKPAKATTKEKQEYTEEYDLNSNYSLKVFAYKGDIYLKNIKTGSIKQVTKTIAYEEIPCFTKDNSRIIYTKNSNLYSWNLNSGVTIQLTNFKTGSKIEETEKSDQEIWLQNDQLKNFEILKNKYDISEERKSNLEKEKKSQPKAIYTKDWEVIYAELSPNEKFVFYQLQKNSGNIKYTKVANFVTKSGYTEIQTARPKVGSPWNKYQWMIYDILKDTSYNVRTNGLSGTFSSDSVKKEREVYMSDPIWNDKGTLAVVDIRSSDNKDRWICLLDYNNGKLKVLDHQKDTAWIGGPGISYYYNGEILGWMPDDQNIWFQSEESGYSHLYSINVNSLKKKMLTNGEYEVYNPVFSRNGSYIYFTANKEHSGIRNLYRLDYRSTKTEKLTDFKGRVNAILSPDEKYFAILASMANEPWELYLLPNKLNSKPEKITNSTTKEFNAYSWRMPEFITFEASDGNYVPARLYQPKKEKKNGAGIIFVHGAGYKQNAHQWWSDYYREYMFHNFLVDQGYTVMDIDYRGSAGYGRDWRTSIYRNMGGKDLSDQIDGANFMINELGLDKSKLGIYGGSYGGFITLMAMFKHPGVFQSGAALRAVTDWAHYNHGYTSNILNTPFTDSLAYYRSSPIYYAKGLEGNLLMCHGMVDDNVQFQDIVRLTQRLIELGKENWELAVYPMEGHSFKEASSWTDEYKRIYKLFEKTLLNKK